jgi:hypothetical protein
MGIKNTVCGVFAERGVAREREEVTEGRKERNAFEEELHNLNSSDVRIIKSRRMGCRTCSMHGREVHMKIW